MSPSLQMQESVDKEEEDEFPIGHAVRGCLFLSLSETDEYLATLLAEGIRKDVRYV